MQIKSLLGEETGVMGKNTVKRPQSAHKHTHTKDFSDIFHNISKCICGSMIQQDVLLHYMRISDKPV